MNSAREALDMGLILTAKKNLELAAKDLEMVGYKEEAEEVRRLAESLPEPPPDEVTRVVRSIEEAAKEYLGSGDSRLTGGLLSARLQFIKKVRMAIKELYELWREYSRRGDAWAAINAKTTADLLSAMVDVILALPVGARIHASTVGSLVSAAQPGSQRGEQLQQASQQPGAAQQSQAGSVQARQSVVGSGSQQAAQGLATSEQRPGVGESEVGSASQLSESRRRVEPGVEQPGLPLPTVKSSPIEQPQLPSVWGGWGGDIVKLKPHYIIKRPSREIEEAYRRGGPSEVSRIIRRRLLERFKDKLEEYKNIGIRDYESGSEATQYLVGSILEDLEKHGGEGKPSEAESGEREG